MRKRVFAAVVLLFVVGATAHAACTVNVHSEVTRGGWPRVFWDPVPGAESYHVEILRKSEHVRSEDLTEPTVDVRFQAATRTALTYRITAVNDSDPSFTACSAAIDVTVQGDPAFGRLTRRLILPVAGSAPGANGAFFRTSLKLIGTFPGERGRVIFHRAGTYPSSNDPSLTYNFNVGGEAFYDDVVAAMGQSGIGYLEIVPDEGTIGYMPRIEARVYNDSPDGTFGTFEDAVNPVDFLGSANVAIYAPESRFRMNLGFIAQGPTYGIIVATAADGQNVSRQIQLEPGTSILASVRDLVGVDPEPGSVVRVVTLNGSSAIVYYTFTDNSTNDPQIFVPPQQPAVVDVSNALQ
ncbi:MAG TPA: hypothetical protein VGR02_07435 [Thermoanaerobaculia bacterium]|jgi:hypothetical protein|nr:hypothetical protein [Thermoanaerobaculia bacterium]